MYVDRRSDGVVLTELVDLVGRHLASPDLVRATLSRKADSVSPLHKAVIRPVELKGERKLQVVTYDATKAYTVNVDDAAAPEVAELLAINFRNANIALTDETIDARLTKRDRLLQSSNRNEAPLTAELSHDRQKARLVPEDARFLDLLGLATEGSVKPSRQAKYRQIHEFVRVLESTPFVRKLKEGDQVRVVDYGCGNAYLTFATYYYLAEVRGLRCELTGVDRNDELVRTNRERAAELGWTGLTFESGAIETGTVPDAGGSADAGTVDIALALHACDTATDDAIVAAVAAEASVMLMAPCCHHHIQAQLSALRDRPPEQALLLRHPILRERLGDVLTDTLRSTLLRLAGYKVDVVQFVDPDDTAKNLLIRASHNDRPVDPTAATDYQTLRNEWSLTPYLEQKLTPHLKTPLT